MLRGFVAAGRWLISPPRQEALALAPFQLPLAKKVFAFTQFKGIPGVVRDAGPDAWGRRVIEHKLERSTADLQEIDYLLHDPQDGACYLSRGLKAEPSAPKRQYNRTHQVTELNAATQVIKEGKSVAAHLLEQPDSGTSMGYRLCCNPCQTSSRYHSLAERHLCTRSN